VGFSEGHQVRTGELKKGIYVSSLSGMTTGIVGPLDVIQEGLKGQGGNYFLLLENFPLCFPLLDSFPFGEFPLVPFFFLVLLLDVLSRVCFSLPLEV